MVSGHDDFNECIAMVLIEVAIVHELLLRAPLSAPCRDFTLRLMSGSSVDHSTCRNTFGASALWQISILLHGM